MLNILTPTLFAEEDDADFLFELEFKIFTATSNYLY